MRHSVDTRFAEFSLPLEWALPLPHLAPSPWTLRLIGLVTRERLGRVALPNPLLSADPRLSKRLNVYFLLPSLCALLTGALS